MMTTFLSEIATATSGDCPIEVTLTRNNSWRLAELLPFTDDDYRCWAESEPEEVKQEIAFKVACALAELSLMAAPQARSRIMTEPTAYDPAPARVTVRPYSVKERAMTEKPEDRLRRLAGEGPQKRLEQDPDEGLPHEGPDGPPVVTAGGYGDERDQAMFRRITYTADAERMRAVADVIRELRWLLRNTPVRKLVSAEGAKDALARLDALEEDHD
jgi:hypothetical protein